MNSRVSFPATTFKKVLKGFEVGGLPYTEVQFQLKRLLASGVSPSELREVLRRSELIEPLPEYAHREVLGLLDEAVEQGAAQSDSEPALEQDDDLDSAPALAADLEAARTALESEQTRIRKIEAALTDRIASEGALRSRLEIMRRDSERYQGELRAARSSLASRDKVTAQMRQTLDERDAQLATLRREYAEAVTARESERRKSQEIERILADKNAANGATRERSEEAQRDSERFQGELRAARNSLASQDKALLQTRQMLAERDVQLAALRQEQTQTVQAPVVSKTRFRVRGWRWNPPATPRAVWVGAAIVLLAMTAWFFVHRPSAPPQTPAAAPTTGMRPGSLIRDCPTCPALTLLPTGRFKQGSAAENGSAFEKPLHWVMIASPIALSTNPVTVDEFRAFVAATGRNMQGCDTYDGGWRHRTENNWESPGFVQTGSHPVTCTSWNDAKAYAEWLSAKTGHRYRLPSASEWEYAARAGGAAAQPWGSDASGACASANVADESAAHRYPGWAVFACNDGYVQTSPVGSFKPNSFGLNDMLGNVFQWTEDCWQPDYQRAPTDGSARMDGDCSERELRGGSWFSTPAYVRGNYRNHFGVDYRTSSVGIRLAREIAP